LRIIGGTARGRRLLPPPGGESRPILDLLKQRLFDILGMRCRDAVVADLFAGVGSLGLEALSRGASRAYLVERDARTAGVLQRNVLALGFSDQAKVLIADSLHLDFGMAIGRASLVFLDPPFRLMDERRDAIIGLLHRALDQAFLSRGGVVVLRTREDVEVDAPAGMMLDRRVHGRNALHIVTSA
jgi:16S rRNA (guanine(966)-N(2))-methyltransferase RsmD